LSNYHQKYLVQRSSCSPSSYYAWRYAWALIPASWSFSLYLCMGAKGCLLVLAYTFVASLAACLCLGCAAGVTRQLFSLYRLLWGHSVQCLMQSTLDIDRTKWSAGKWIPDPFKNKILVTKKTLVVVRSCIASPQSTSDALWRGRGDSIQTKSENHWKIQ
jgi:hypothetical protein